MNTVMIQAAEQVHTFNGQWITNDQRVYTFLQVGNQVSGTVDNNSGWKFDGTVAGNVLTGRWSDPPYTATNHNGNEIITLSEDGTSIFGKWNYGPSENGIWFEFTGTRSTVVQEDLKITLSADVFTGCVKLMWNADASGLIEGYNLYRGTSAGNEDNEPINDALIPTTPFSTSVSYTNYIATKGIYYYTCKAIFKDKTLSASSNEIAAYVSDVSKNITLFVDNPKMTVNGESIEIDPGRGTTPILVNNRTLVPIRAIVNALGGRIKWDASESKVSIKQDIINLALWINQSEALIGTERKVLDVTPQIINGRTMLPLRFVSENLGCMVNWDETSRKITLTK